MSGETNRLEMITARSQSLEVKNKLNQIKIDIGIVSPQIKHPNTTEELRPADTILIAPGDMPLVDSAVVKRNRNWVLRCSRWKYRGSAKRLRDLKLCPTFQLVILTSQSGAPRMLAE
ncbi:MAG: hypothetical protein U0T33_12995 [Bacteroidales bacterium]